MTAERTTALALAVNLTRLMEHHGMSQPQLAKKSGVAQRTLSTLLDVGRPLEMNPRSTTIDLLASAFGIPGWQLLIPDLPLDLLLDTQLERVIGAYREAPAEGRTAIVRIAEMEARYAGKEQKNRPDQAGQSSH